MNRKQQAVLGGSVIPCLQILEDRWCPATTYTWAGGTSPAWTDGRNWTGGTGAQGDYPGAAGHGGTDIVHLDHSATNQPTLNAAVTVAELDTNSGWGSVTNLPLMAGTP
jgi:hypothetical protein